MKNSLYFMITFLLFFFLGINYLNNPKDKIREKKEDPSDWFFMQRAYPSGKIPLHKYYEAIEKKDQMMRLDKTAGSLTWELRGPTNVGGRISDVEMSPTNLDTMYAGAATGGVFKSVNGGASWQPVFDQSPSLSIGDIALDPANPNIVYVGTGEVNCGGGSMTYGGDGIYKSTDAGATWSQIGLQATQYISRIVVDPSNSQRIFVGAMGRLFDTNPERGLYLSTDGGLTWNKKLFISDSTGCIDVAINPQQPSIVYAAMWERTRRPDRELYGGSTSGLYRSTDGGETWTQLTNGIPHNSNTVGRIGIAISKSSPNIIYAVYADDVGYFAGLFKSTNGGDSWTRTNDGALGYNYVSYGWWFGNIRVDPSNPNIVYQLGLDVYKTTNGGNSWFDVSGIMHVDHHGMYIHPQNPNFLIEGNDGGIYKSTNGGSSWTYITQIPITQFYDIDVDYQYPQRLYGGAQDNGTSRTLTGNLNDWEFINGGDGFYVLVDPVNNNYIYSEYQYGSLSRSTDGGNTFIYAMNGISGSDRFNWNSPVALDPSNPATLYFGSQRIYKSTNHAASWTAISPDLSNGTPTGNLVYGTVTTIAAAPSDPNVIYAGTDDANVWVTLDGGSNWTKISDELPNFWVTRVAVDPYDAMTAYVTISGYRNDEYLPHVFRTFDAGNSWTDISSNLPDAPVNDFIVDPFATGVFFAATDVGVFYTTDFGMGWYYLGNPLPNVPITDLVFHSPTKTLIAGSFGRSMYSIDVSSIIPVELTSFSGRVENGSVILNWSTATETNNRGFEVERSQKSEDGNQNWENVGFVNGNGTTTKQHNYSFKDNKNLSGNYNYRLKQIDFDGSFEYSNIVEVNITSPVKFSLEQNYPNPFNPGTVISWKSPVSSRQTLKVYDVLGREVATLVNEYKPAGTYQVEFNASKLPSGIYFYRLNAGSFTQTKKMILIK